VQGVLETDRCSQGFQGLRDGIWQASCAHNRFWASFFGQSGQVGRARVGLSCLALPEGFAFLGVLDVQGQGAL